MAEMLIDAGELDKRIEIFIRRKSYDAADYETAAEETVRRCWARFTRQSGKESLTAGADLSTVTARFLIRASSTKVSRLMYVRYAGDVYEISYVNDYGDQGQYVELLAELKELGGQHGTK